MSGSVKVYFPEWTQAELVALLKEKVRTLTSKLPLRRVVLFGSYAKRRQTAASDVDLLVVYEGRRKDAYDTCLSVLRIPRLELHLYTGPEYDEMRKSKTSLVSEAEREGITILQVGKD